MRRKWLGRLGWSLVALTALFFIWSGLKKLAGTEEMAAMFAEFGYADWVRILIGIAETAGGIGLLVRPLTGYAAACLAGLMAGAVWTELAHGHSFESLIPAQWLVVLVITAFIRLRRRGKKSGAAVEPSGGK